MLLISSACAPCPFANSRTFWPASSALIDDPLIPPVASVAINRTARTTVEIAQ